MLKTVNSYVLDFESSWCNEVLSIIPQVLLATTHSLIRCDSADILRRQKLFFQLTFTDAVPANDQTKILSSALTDGGEADSERENLVLLLAPLDSRLARESQ